MAFCFRSIALGALVAGGCFNPEENRPIASGGGSTSGASSSSEGPAPDTTSEGTTGAAAESSTGDDATASSDDTSTAGTTSSAGCMTPMDCPVGDCVNAECVFEYGPCESCPCDCPFPSNSIYFEGGCFCYVRCGSDECPALPGGFPVPVCAMDQLGEYLCGLPCRTTIDCPVGMECITVPEGLPPWGDSVCVFPD